MIEIKDATQFTHELADKYTLYFDVFRDETLDQYTLPFYAIYRRRDERYMLSKKVTVYGVENQQIVLATIRDVLTEEFVTSYQQTIEKNVGNFIPTHEEHMSTVVIGMIITDSPVDGKIVKKVKRYRKLKFLKFGLHGWLEIYTALINPLESSIDIHSKGKPFIQSIEKILKGETS